MPAKKNAANKPARRKAPRRRPRPKRKKPESLRLRESVVGLTVNDIARSIAWYRDVLGWTVGEEWRDQGTLLGAEMVAGKISVFLGQDDWKKGRARKKGEGLRLYFRTAQPVDDLAALIKSRGGVLDHEPKDEPWGERDFGITDPDGFKITISNRR
jgi:catechol 2,3-dioxygenase-like lactoylglutathione lyase family enzyme